VGAIEEASIEPEWFDIVTSTSTLEHIARPLEHVERIMEILKPGGVAYFTVPNYGSLPICLHLVKGRLVSPPGHCNYFTRRTLRNLFMQEGLKDQVAKITVRSYGIPEIHGVYGWFSKRKSKATHSNESRKMRKRHLKRALVNTYYWTGAPFGLGDKLEAWVEKARLSNSNSPAR
jgi:SAM-dependent methyltransferase